MIVTDEKFIRLNATCGVGRGFIIEQGKFIFKHYVEYKVGGTEYVETDVGSYFSFIHEHVGGKCSVRGGYSYRAIPLKRGRWYKRLIRQISRAI